MNNLKAFDPDDIDESLLRQVAYGGKYYALFPYVDATGPAPEFKSVRREIMRDAISVDEINDLSQMIKRRGENAAWLISFSTPWLLKRTDADEMRQRARGTTRPR